MCWARAVKSIRRIDVPPERRPLPHLLSLLAALVLAGTWGSLATILRTSTDHGATWSKARLIIPEHGIRHMPIESVFRTQDGAILLPCDAVTGGAGGTAIHLSYDNGATWNDPGGTIKGIHAPVVQLNDGRLMSLGRGDQIDGRMPRWILRDEFCPAVGTDGDALAVLAVPSGGLEVGAVAVGTVHGEAPPADYRPGSALSPQLALPRFAGPQPVSLPVFRSPAGVGVLQSTRWRPLGRCTSTSLPGRRSRTS